MSVTQGTGEAIQMVREILQTRLDAMDRAVALLQTRVDREPSTINLDQRLLAEVNLTAQKFLGINDQFNQRDLAVAAALAAAKEMVTMQNSANTQAINKSETATEKQLDQIYTMMQTLGKSMDDKISDIKDRLTVIESVKKGIGDSWGFVVAAGGLITAILIAYASFR